MRIVLIGQAAFGEKVLKDLLARNEEVAAVFLPPDKGPRPDPLKVLAGERGIAVYQPEHMRNPQVLETMKELAPDLGIMAFVTDIVPVSVLRVPRLGTIQYHPSLLPRHRGGSAINWAILHGDRRTGVTIFWPDGGIDTGPILLQKEADISPDDTVGSLYFDKLFPMGINAISEALDLIYSGKAPKMPQDESQATYEGLCRENDALINWDEPVEDVYRLIRGTNPQPGATTSYKGEKVKIFDSEIAAGQSTGQPGEIVNRSEEGITVSCRTGRLLVKRVQPSGKAKISAWDYSNSTGLIPGEKFS